MAMKHRLRSVARATDLGAKREGRGRCDLKHGRGRDVEWARGPSPGALPRPPVAAPVVGIAPWQWQRRPDTGKHKTHSARCKFHPITPAGRSAETERWAFGAACLVGPVGAARLARRRGRRSRLKANDANRGLPSKPANHTMFSGAFHPMFLLAAFMIW